MTETLLEVEHLTHVFGSGKTAVRAVDDVSFTVAEGETFGLVGESGSGKSTTGRAVVGLRTPTSGTIRYRGRDVATLLRDRRTAREFRREVQMVFQDPHASLDPRMTVGQVVAEGLVIAKEKARLQQRVEEALSDVGLDPSLSARYPHELSGGQRQRVGIARALILGPRLIVCDEPISALDVSVQAQVVNLLRDLAEQRGLSYLFIAHDLAMVRYVSDRIGVMYQGRLVEEGPTAQVYETPRHEYTRSLLEAAAATAV